MLYLQLFWVYIKIGIFGFGGGYAMLSLIQDEVVNKHQWITAQEFTDIVAISQITPGPIGINSATYVGYSITGNIWGAMLATFAVVLPSFLLVLVISASFKKFRSNKYIDAAFTGIRPASVGLIASAALLLMFHSSFITLLIHGTIPSQPDQIFISENFINGRSLIIFGFVFICSLKKWLHPIPLIVIAGITGLFLF